MVVSREFQTSMSAFECTIIQSIVSYCTQPVARSHLNVANHQTPDRMNVAAFTLVKPIPDIISSRKSRTAG